MLPPMDNSNVFDYRIARFGRYFPHQFPGGGDQLNVQKLARSFATLISLITKA